MTKAPKATKSAILTLRAGGSTLTFTATQRPDGTVKTVVVTRDADKKAARGMSETHADMATAKAHMTTLAKKAETLGWQKRSGFAGKPDAFSKLPAAPKVA